ncbi:hypothetical protein BT96DRAFT_977196 [Gymnopus androsaceus JB14]|uniref:Uncharacterized protein n=1 Tax=Gymnopus androsaceus JB14 TaxID=1447944 RepID=A0A6A4HEW3_9AGAR|nr:hypothetical protein BT96DRAFT_977196 [Gymnopus androsaceus JB14]
MATYELARTRIPETTHMYGIPNTQLEGRSKVGCLEGYMRRDSEHFLALPQNGPKVHVMTIRVVPSTSDFEATKSGQVSAALTCIAFTPTSIAFLRPVPARFRTATVSGIALAPMGHYYYKVLRIINGVHNSVKLGWILAGLVVLASRNSGQGIQLPGAVSLNRISAQSPKTAQKQKQCSKVSRSMMLVLVRSSFVPLTVVGADHRAIIDTHRNLHVLQDTRAAHRLSTGVMEVIDDWIVKKSFYEKNNPPSPSMLCDSVLGDSFILGC